MIFRLSAWLAAGAIISTAAAGTWRADIEPTGGSTVKGMATVEAADSMTAKAHISISGAKEGDVLPWHVHSGTCDNAGPPIGTASAYQPLTVGADGNAMGDATMSVAPSDSASYVVNVHRSASDMSVIACGLLKNGQTTTPQ